MKKILLILSVCCILSSIAFLISCGEEEGGGGVSLKANAGEDITAEVLTTVSLNASASIIPDGQLTSEWIFNNGPAPVGEITFDEHGVEGATFIPPKNGVYSFTLRLEQGANFSEDAVLVTVTGVLSLEGTLASSMQLKNIEPDQTKPDYVISSDVVVSIGASLSLPSGGNPGDIVIEFAESTSLTIQAGGSVNLSGARLTSATSWEGIVLEGGSFTTAGYTQLENAGGEGSGAITVTGGTLSITGLVFSGSPGYDLLIEDMASSSTITGNTFSSLTPVKMAIDYLPSLGSNIYPDGYEYITLTTPGAGTTVGVTSSFVFLGNTKYYIDGDFTAGSPISAQGSATILMKEGAGIVASAGTSIGFNGYGITFDGLDGAPWKGIAVGGDGSTLNGIEVKNAGSAIFSTGSFTSDVKAAVYYYGDVYGTMNNTEITNSDGYGLYVASNVYVVTQNSTFTDCTLPAISGMVNSVHNTISTDDNTFDLSEDVAAVEVRSPNPATYNPAGTWKALGEDNYYLVTGNLFGAANWTLSPGVNLKFKTGKSIDIQAGIFTAVGTSENPITFDSEAGTAGTWPGILLENRYNLEYCQIKNGGSAYLLKGGITPATEKANVVFNNNTHASNTFKNNTITGSGGYGVYIEFGKQNPDALNPANANTFSGNTQASVGTMAVCGDGALQTPEGCDDANTANGDGCSAVCTVEVGYECTGSPSVCIVP